MLIELLIKKFSKFVNNVNLSIEKSIVIQQLRYNNINAICKYKNLIKFFFLILLIAINIFKKKKILVLKIKQ